MSIADVTINAPRHEVRPAPARSSAPANVAAACLFLGPVTLAIGLTLSRFDLWTDRDTPDFAAIADGYDQARLSIEFGMAGSAVMIGAVLALAIAARQIARAATAGAAIAVVGLVAMAYQSAADLPLLAMDGLGATAELDQVATRYADLAPAFSWAYALYPTGVIVLAVALGRSGSVSRWAALAVAIGGLFPLAAAIGVGALAIPFAAVFIGGAVPVARALRKPA